MKDILKEIISEFYLVTEYKTKGAKDKTPRTRGPNKPKGDKVVPGSSKQTKGDKVVPDGLYAGTGGRYYKDAQLTQHVGTVSGTGNNRKYTPVDVAPEPSPDSAAPATPQSTQKTKAKAKAKANAEPTAEPVTGKSLADTIASLVGKKFVNTNVATDLESALRSGDENIIRAVIDNHGLRIDKYGKLVGPGTGDARKILGGDDKKSKQLADELDIYLRNEFEYQLPSEYIGVVKTSASKFMPTKMYTETVRIDIQTLQNGVSIDGIELTTMDENTITTRVEDTVSRVRELRAEFTPEFEQNVRDYITLRFLKSNHNVTYLQELTSGKTELIAYRFVGQAGKNTMAAKLSEAISTTGLDDAVKNQILAAVDTMRTADRKSFDAAYMQFKIAAKGTSVEKSIKYIAETITAMRTITGGGVAYIPKSASFKLADIVSIGKDPLSGNIEAKQILIEMEEESLTSAARSVKENKGAAASNSEKIKNSIFNTDVDGATYPDVKSDLTYLCGMRDEIFTFGGKNGGKNVDAAAEQKLNQFIGKYQSMIVAYYGLENQLPADESQQIKYIYNLLSFGKALGCGKNGTIVPDLSADIEGTDPEPFKPGSSLNGRQWRAWSVLGKITDAIHNKSVRAQFYDTVRFNGKITVADGIRRFSKMESQHLKKPAEPKNAPKGYKRPDGHLNAFTIPSSIADTRNGNPCT